MPRIQEPPAFSLPTAIQQALLPRVVRAINHLIEREPQARSRLRMHAGKQVMLRAPSVRVMLAVAQDGAFQVHEADAHDQPPALCLDVDASAMLAAKMRGQPLGLTGVHITGDAEFAQTMSWLMANLRWDAEDDLAGLIGDVGAHRVARAARGLMGEVQRLRHQLEGDARDWVAESPRALVGRGEFTTCSAQVAQLRDAVARMDKRITLLARHARSLQS